ncbi:TnsD family Tn7-like transposition protein [Paenibacillus jamilae]|nr:TnsD family Tn7-like transposition protein [Paenibacillus jamilae]
MNKLSFFPMPYPDELFYSVLARYHLLSGNSGYKSTTFELFNTYNAAAIVDLNSHLNTLVQKIPSKSSLTEDEIIAKHTLFPFYAPFLPKERSEKVIECMKSSRGGSVHNRVGIVSSNVKTPSHLRFCSACLEEDLKVYGESYWRRMHQIPGLLICQKHHEVLSNSEVIINRLGKREYILATRKICTNVGTIELSHRIREQMVSLANRVKQVIEGKYESKDRTFFSKRYADILKSKKLMTEGKNMLREEIYRKFNEFYEAEFLSLTQSTLDNEDWVTNIVRSTKSSDHPIRHLIFIGFLQTDFEEIMSDKKLYAPFGEGFWPCLNPAANHFKQKVIETVLITRCIRTKKTLGTFKCTCGFYYQSYAPNNESLDIYKADKIIRYGETWEEKLRELVDMGRSLSIIARELNTAPYILKKLAYKLNLDVSWRTARKDRKKMSFKEKQLKYRKLWIDNMKINPKLKRSDIGKIYNGAYYWLLANDREWLDSILPAEKLTNKIFSDWNQRDIELLDKVERIIMEINTSDQPVRRSIPEVSRRLGMNPDIFYKHIRKMPRLNEFINNAKESMEEFQLRKLHWAFHQLRKHSTFISKAQLINKARISGIQSKIVVCEMEYLLSGIHTPS